MRIVALAGGVGGARFLRGLLAALARSDGSADGDASEVTVVGNTADDITLYGLRVCPDLDTIMYTLGGGVHEGQGWGREDDSYAVQGDLEAYGAEPQWFRLGDRDIATHVVRSQLLAAGYRLSEVTATLCRRWQPGVTLLPMSDEPVETHVIVDDGAGGRRAVHFQEYWVRLHAEPAAYAIVPVGAAGASPAPGVVEALAAADVVLLPPSNPVVSIGTILAVPGIADAVRAARAPVVGVSPLVGGAPVRGYADRVLAAVGVAATAAAVAVHYGARTDGGLLDGWLVDTADAGAVPEVAAAGIRCAAVPLLMTDVDAAAAMADAALDLAARVRA